MKRPFSVTRKANGKLLVRVVVGYKGKNAIRESKEFPVGTTDVAINAWAYAVKAGNPYETPAARADSVDSVIDKWLASKQYTVGARTYSNYETYSRLYIKGKLSAFNKEAIADWLFSLRKQDGSPLATKTLDTIRIHVKNVMAFAVEEGYLDSIPKVPVSPGAKRLKTVKVLSPQQVHLLNHRLTMKGERALEVLLLTGLRVSELLALEPRHIIRKAIVVDQVLESRWGKRNLAPPKSARSYRTIPINPVLYHRLRLIGKNLPPGEKFLFRIGPTGLSKRLKRHCEALALPQMSLRSLRHTHCTYLLALGADIVKVSAIMGHYNPGFTLNNYSHLVPVVDEKITSIMNQLVGLGKATS